MIRLAAWSLHKRLLVQSSSQQLRACFGHPAESRRALSSAALELPCREVCPKSGLIRYSTGSGYLWRRAGRAMSQLLKDRDFSTLLRSDYAGTPAGQRIQLWDLLLQNDYRDVINIDEQRPLLKEAFVLVVDAEQLRNDWQAAPLDDSRPGNRPWFELLDLTNELSLLVPEEANPARRALGFIDSRRTDGYAVVALDTEGRAITAGTVLNGCDLARDLKSCNGRCPDGNQCALKRYATYPVTAHCRC